VNLLARGSSLDCLERLYDNMGYLVSTQKNNLFSLQFIPEPYEGGKLIPEGTSKGRLEIQKIEAPPPVEVYASQDRKHLMYVYPDHLMAIQHDELLESRSRKVNLAGVGHGLFWENLFFYSTLQEIGLIILEITGEPLLITLASVQLPDWAKASIAFIEEEDYSSSAQPIRLQKKPPGFVQLLHVIDCKLVVLCDDDQVDLISLEFPFLKTMLMIECGLISEAASLGKRMDSKLHLLIAQVLIEKRQFSEIFLFEGVLLAGAILHSEIVECLPNEKLKTEYVSTLFEQLDKEQNEHFKAQIHGALCSIVKKNETLKASFKEKLRALEKKRSVEVLRHTKKETLRSLMSIVANKS
jgi:hypothetical protein